MCLLESLGDVHCARHFARVSQCGNNNAAARRWLSRRSHRRRSSTCTSLGPAHEIFIMELSFDMTSFMPSLIACRLSCHTPHTARHPRLDDGMQELLSRKMCFWLMLLHVVSLNTCRGKEEQDFEEAEEKLQQGHEMCISGEDCGITRGHAKSGSPALTQSSSCRYLHMLELCSLTNALMPRTHQPLPKMRVAYELEVVGVVSSLGDV